MAPMEYKYSNALFSTCLEIFEQLHLKERGIFKIDLLNTLDDYHVFLKNTLQAYETKNIKFILYDFNRVYKPVIRRYLIMYSNTYYSSPSYAPIGPEAGKAFITKLYLDILAGGHFYTWKSYGYNCNNLISTPHQSDSILFWLCKEAYLLGYISKNEAWYFIYTSSDDYIYEHHRDIQWLI